MFGFLAQLISRGWWLILGIWIAAFVALRMTTPSINEVAKGGEFTFLPDSMASRQAEKLLSRAFPGRQTTSNVVIVVHRDDPKGLTDDDRTFIEDQLLPEIQESIPLSTTEASSTTKTATKSKSEIVTAIHSVSDRGVGELLQSVDHKSSLIQIELATDFQDNRNWEIVRKAADIIQKAQGNKELPQGLQFALTGSATLGRDMSAAESQSARYISAITVGMVVVLLLLIYRAPLLALIPLLTLFIAVDVSLHVLTALAQAGYLSIFRGLQEYTTVIAYGPGIDYCLFLIARYKEHLQKCVPPKEALSDAVRGVGSAIVASGATVVCGIGMLTFAQFGKFHEAGQGISIAILITLVASLTLTPALLRLVGHWAFWPKPGFHCNEVSEASQATSSVDKTVVQSNMFEPMWVYMGDVIRRNPVRVLAVTLASMIPFAVLGLVLHERVNYGLLESLPKSTTSVAGANVLEKDFPAGVTGPVGVLLQNSTVDFRQDEGIDHIRQLVDELLKQREQLKIADIRSVSNPLGTIERHADSEEKSLFSKVVEKRASQQRSVEYYVSSAPGLNGHVTQLDVVLSTNPFSIESVHLLDTLQEAIHRALPAGPMSKTEVQLVGPTASVRDVTLISHSDQQRIYLLVVTCVFLILLVLLRSFIISLYLIMTVLLSFVATLGVTWLVFYGLDPHGFIGLDWTVPLFLFVVLIAVGEDYNIFLVSRIQEEQVHHGQEQGILVGLKQTGGIITSCGFIMAGTFASLGFGTLARMQQLGFALAFGVLLDTFIIRPILVPAFLMIWTRRSHGALHAMSSPTPANSVAPTPTA